MDDLLSNDSVWQPDGDQYDGEEQEPDMEVEDEYEEEEVEEEEEDDDGDNSRFPQEVFQLPAVPRGQQKRNAPHKRVQGNRSQWCEVRAITIARLHKPGACESVGTT